MFLSFCIITIGDKPDKLRLSVESIHRNFASREAYEIIVVGNNLDQFKDLDIILIEDNEYIEFLGKRKNIATQNSKGDILVYCDDDVLFPRDWHRKFLEFYRFNEDWQIMGNRVLLPDGSRYWDRSIYLPIHTMVDYDFYSTNVLFYQSGCFCVCKRGLEKEVAWSDTIPFYGKSKGFLYNEDVEFSLRLKEKNIDIHFDKNNVVWHNDFSYKSDNISCNKNRTPKRIDYKSLDFITLINSLS